MTRLGFAGSSAVALAGVCASLSLASRAYATAELRISDGTNYVDIVDNGSAVCVGLFNPADCVDRNTLTGQVLFIGTLGAWRIVNAIGINQQTLSPGGSDLLELAATLVHQVDDASSLTILFSDNGFTSGGRLYSAGDVSTAGSSSAYSAFEDGVEFGGCSGLPVPGACNGQIGSTLPVLGPSGMGTTSGNGIGGALTLVGAELTVPVSGFVSLGATVSNATVPEPPTGGLFGIALTSALLCAGVWRPAAERLTLFDQS